MQMDQISGVAGQWLSGTVQANIRHAYKGQNLCIELRGNERTMWEESNGDDTTYYRDKEKFLKMSFPVWGFPDFSVPIGQFSFPFKLQLPHWLPSSFVVCKSTSNQLYEIKYKIKAYFETDHPIDKKGGEIKFRSPSRQIIVRQPAAMRDAQLTCEMTKGMTKCCCFNQGITKMQGHFEKALYF